jgi:hypothetical protein
LESRSVGTGQNKPSDRDPERGTRRKATYRDVFTLCPLSLLPCSPTPPPCVRLSLPCLVLPEHSSLFLTSDLFRTVEMRFHTAFLALFLSLVAVNASSHLRDSLEARKWHSRGHLSHKVLLEKKSPKNGCSRRGNQVIKRF